MSLNISGLIPELIWIGINDFQREGSFVAVDGRPISWTKWYRGEPNNFKGIEDAVVLGWKGDTRWNDMKYWEKYRFVCLLHMAGKFLTGGTLRWYQTTEGS